MRRFRNPRFAPESLERKLNPSAPVGTMALAQFAEVSRMEAPVAETTTVNYGLPMCAETPDTPPTHPVPGDGSPLSPPPGSTTPPDGSGDPPTSSPSLPGGGGGDPA